MLNPEDMEKARNVQLGLSQFEKTHLPLREKNGEESLWVCPTCDVDFPCERMLIFMLLQSISALTAMVPSGNMGALMQRFTGGANKK